MPAEGEGPVILAMDFASPPPWGEARVAKLRALAESIAAETPGLLWKIWTEDAAAGRAGGIYAFASRAEAEAYRAMHTARVTERGATDIRGAIWAVNGPLSALTRAPL
jgi:endonuclease/exonuclease/phosphatase (EEP) superfamily protein YafD